MFNSDQKKQFQFIVNLVMLLSIVFSSILPTIATISSPKENSNRLLASGQRAYDFGFYDQALEKFNAAIDKYKFNYEAYAYRAATEMALGDLSAAMNDVLVAEENIDNDVFIKTIKAQILQSEYDSLNTTEIAELENLLDELVLTDPENYDYRLWRGSYYFNQNQFEKTIEDLKNFTSRADAMLFTGSSYFQLGQYELAIDTLEIANAMSPQNDSILQQLVISYFSEEEYEKALNYQIQLANLGTSDPVVYKDLGMLYILNEEYELALDSYEKASIYAPVDKEIFYQIGVLSYEINEYEKAVDAFSEAIALQNDWKDAYLNRATAYISLEEYELAYEDYLSCLAFDPESIDILQKISELDIFLGRIDTSIEHFGQLIEKDPENIQYLFTHAYLVITNQIENCSVVEPELEKIIEVDESQTIPYHYLGLCEYSKGNHEKAAEYWNLALTGLPETIDSLYFLAFLDYENSNYESALEKINQLESFDSNYALGYFLKANIELELAKYQEAIEDYDVAIANDINVMIAYFNQGVAYFNLGNLLEAESCFLIALEFANKDGQIELGANIQSALDTLYEHPDWGK